MASLDATVDRPDRAFRFTPGRIADEDDVGPPFVSLGALLEPLVDRPQSALTRQPSAAYSTSLIESMGSSPQTGQSGFFLTGTSSNVMSLAS